MNKLFRVSASAFPDSHGISVKEIEVEKETDKCYFFDNQRIKKTELTKPCTKFMDTALFKSYYTYCNESDIDSSKLELIELVQSLVKSQYETVKSMYEESMKLTTNETR